MIGKLDQGLYSLLPNPSHTDMEGWLGVVIPLYLCFLLSIALLSYKLFVKPSSPLLIVCPASSRTQPHLHLETGT